ncbi:MAG: hypothetical protein KGI27_09350 [Thaumarchaeota archaeon]|nr:hypothetical protein [Nitrososphaerota archaeon]
MVTEKNTNRHKTVHCSFRANENTLLELEKESATRNIHTSSLINEILDAYVSHSRHFEQLEFVPVPKDFLRKWIPRISKIGLEKDARELGVVIAREYISYFFEDVNGRTLAEFLDVWLGRLGPHQHKIKDGTHWYAVNHDINMQFSIHLKEFLSALIESITMKPVRFIEVTPNVVTFSFEV